MFHLDLPNVYKVLTNGEFKLDEILGGGGSGNNKEDDVVAVEGGKDKDKQQEPKHQGNKKDAKSKQIIVVSVFGSSFYQTLGGKGNRPRYKRAFQLALDAFGTVGMYDGEKKDISKHSREEFVDRRKDAREGNGQEGNSTIEKEAKNDDEEDREEATTSESVNRGQKTKQLISTGGKLEGFLNEDESVLFLHIEGFAYDAASCMEACQELRSSMKESQQGFLSLWSSFNTSYCKWLLLLFSLSHVMILSETGGSFDTSYITLFRALDVVRLDVLSSVSKILSTIEGLPRQWIDHSRLCSPRLIFLFEVETGNPTKFLHHQVDESSVSPMIGETTSQNNVKEKKDLLQNEIYQIFRKCRIITNISANSLFAVPATDDFVHIFDKSAQNTMAAGGSGQSLSFTYLELINAFTTNRKQRLASPREVGGGGGVGVTTSSGHRTSSSTVLPIKSSFRSHHNTLTYSDTVTSFRKFLEEHISVALDKGFDDDYRRVSGNKHFFVRPTLGQWVQAYEKLVHFLIMEPSGSKRISEAYSHMERFINVDSEYLEIQCADLFPKVFLAYQRGLSEFYTGQQHQQKLNYAVNLFLNISRGPGVIPWLKKLAVKCEKHWKSGRQQCETLSLLGHVCAQSLHKIRRKDHLEIVRLPEMDDELPELQHSSSSRLVSYCNCGKRQSSREEPFTIRQANYDFYRKIARECCDKLEAYDFSVFAPSADDNTAELSLQEMIVILQRKSESLLTVSGGVGVGGVVSVKESTHNNNAQQNGTTMERRVGVNDDRGPQEEVIGRLDLASQEELPEVFEAELRQEESNEEDLEEEEEEEEESEQDEMIVGEAVNHVSSKNKSDDGETEMASNPGVKGSLVLGGPRSLFKRNSSTVEYLPGMYHSKSPLGLLPLFPSWSLLCLGPSSIYSHSHGVSQHGFISGANCLLPWDVKVKAESGVVFVPPSRLMRDKRRQPRPRRQEILVSSHLPPSTSPGAANPNTTNEFSVKVFFGFEYECRKGHRFFCDSNEKVLYALNISQVTQKTIAGKVIGSDMPLYVYCPCKENRDSKQIAQLLRIHIVTPKAPVFVTLQPKVIPGPSSSGAPLFSPSPPNDDSTDTVKLTPSTYWILRLPFSYVGEVVYVPPTDISKYNGKLLKGIFNVVSMSTRETEEWEKHNQNRI